MAQVFEKLGLSLYDFLSLNQYRPFKVDVVRDFGRQLLESVAYLHSLELIHTDLKPENILLAACDDDRKSPTPGIRLVLFLMSFLFFLWVLLFSCSLFSGSLSLFSLIWSLVSSCWLRGYLRG